MIDTLEILKAELAEAGALLRAAFPKGIQVGDKLMDAAEYAPELCGWTHRKGRWPTGEEVCAGIKNAGGYVLTAKGLIAPIPARLIWTNPDTN
jgi:hypothetical protein